MCGAVRNKGLSVVSRTISTLAGTRRKLDGGVLFGHTPRQKWSQWMTPDLDNRVDFADYDKDHDGVFEKRMYDDDGDGWLDRTVWRTD